MRIVGRKTSENREGKLTRRLAWAVAFVPLLASTAVAQEVTTDRAADTDVVCTARTSPPTIVRSRGGALVHGIRLERCVDPVAASEAADAERPMRDRPGPGSRLPG